MPQLDKHLETLTRRLAKNSKRLGPWAKRENLQSFRLYDQDIPEIPISVDIYGEHGVLTFNGENHRPYSLTPAWQASIEKAVQESLSDRTVHTKSRHPDKDNALSSLGNLPTVISVTERGHVFEVDLTSRLDTGLFMDHREARRWLAANSPGKRILNLFAYTGSFSVYGAKADASRVVSVDASKSYCQWAERNLALNQQSSKQHPVVVDEVRSFLEATKEIFDIIIMDPPTFSAKKGAETFDVQRDHGALIALARRILDHSGQILFSSNRRKFKLDPDLGKNLQVTEKTKLFEPKDFRRYPRSYLISASK